MRANLILIFAYALATVGALLAALPLLDRKSKKWSLPERMLLGLVGASIVLGIAHETLTHREGLDASKLAKDTAEAAGTAALSAGIASVTAAGAGDEAASAARDARKASEEATKSVEKLDALVGDVKRTADEVIRTAEPIESISFDVQFDLPMSHPALADYKKRLDRKAIDSYALGNVTHNGKGEPTIGTYGFSMSVQRLGQPGPYKQTRKRGVWFTRDSELFPTKDEPLAGSVLGISVREIALYKRPIDLKDFSYTRFDEIERGIISTKALGPRENPPDLAIHGNAPNQVAQIRVGYDDNSLPPHRYRAWIQKWGPPIGEWHFASDRIHYVGDLPGVQLLLVTTDGLRQPEGALEMLRQIEILRARLSINYHGVELGPNDFEKRFDPNGYPIWEFIFTADRKKLFSPGV